MVTASKVQSLCRNSDCASQLVPSNGAVNFHNPALSVVLAIQKGVVKPRQRILEFGAGNLRNTIFVQRSLRGARVHAYDLQATIDRFPHQYEEFRDLGGIVVTDLSHQEEFDVIICTFVVETICPIGARIHALRTIHSLLSSNGYLVASFRGYGGVRGSKYKRCSSGDGLLSPQRTFIKPHSVTEVRRLLHRSGSKEITLLQDYRVDAPENIHLIAR